MNGGYLMVSKTDTNLYEKLNKALTIGKPVLWYEDENTCYYIDTITKSGTDIILTKGGKSITIESDGDIIEIGNIQNHLYTNNIYITGTDEDNNSLQMVIEINTSTPLSTDEDIEEYIKRFTGSTYFLAVSGMCNNLSLEYMCYANDNYLYYNTNAVNKSFTISNIYNRVIQVF